MTPLRSILMAWDGSSVDELREATRTWTAEPMYVKALVRLAADADVQIAATWLLKQHVERQEALDIDVLQRMYSQLDDVVVAEARLHTLQIIPFIGIPHDALDAMERFLDECHRSRHTFVRAWSYTGWYELARTFPEYREQVDALLQDGLEHGKASVKARIRNLMAE